MCVKDKRIIVTGAGSGIGRDIATKLLAKGAIVGAVDIDSSRLTALEKNERLISLHGDVSDRHSVSRIITQFLNIAGQIDALINNAGVVHNAPLLNFKLQDSSNNFELPKDINVWEQTLRVNLGGVFLMTREVVPCMLQQRIRGVIVNISSICSAGNSGQGAYSAAKAGVEALTVSWSKELGPLGIRVAGVAPGYTETETTLSSMTSEVIKEWKRLTPLRRLATAGEITKAILFVLENDFFTGRIIQVDGGLRL